MELWRSCHATLWICCQDSCLGGGREGSCHKSTCLGPISIWDFEAFAHLGCVLPIAITAVCAQAQRHEERLSICSRWHIVLCYTVCLFLRSNFVVAVLRKFSVLYCIVLYWALAQHDSCGDKIWSELVTGKELMYFGTSIFVPWSVFCPGHSCTDIRSGSNYTNFTGTLTILDYSFETRWKGRDLPIVGGDASTTFRGLHRTSYEVWDDETLLRYESNELNGEEGDGAGVVTLARVKAIPSSNSVVRQVVGSVAIVVLLSVRFTHTLSISRI